VTTQDFRTASTRKEQKQGEPVKYGMQMVTVTHIKADSCEIFRVKQRRTVQKMEVRKKTRDTRAFGRPGEDRAGG